MEGISARNFGRLYLYFAEFGTGKIVKVVFASATKKLSFLGSYMVAGYGYDIKSANMIFIDRKAKIAEY